jgi:hypothetical protein
MLIFSGVFKDEELMNQGKLRFSQKQIPLLFLCLLAEFEPNR